MLASSRALCDNALSEKFLNFSIENRLVLAFGGCSGGDSGPPSRETIASMPYALLGRGDAGPGLRCPLAVSALASPEDVSGRVSRSSVLRRRDRNGMAGCCSFWNHRKRPEVHGDGRGVEEMERSRCAVHVRLRLQRGASWWCGCSADNNAEDRPRKLRRGLGARRCGDERSAGDTHEASDWRWECNAGISKSRALDAPCGYCCLLCRAKQVPDLLPAV